MEADASLRKRVVELCNKFQLEQDIVYKKAEFLIENYHDIVWFDAEKARQKLNAQDTAFQKDPEAAILYLADIDPSDDKNNIFTKMFLLFEAKWLKELVDSAMDYVGSFSKDGDLYCSILGNELYKEKIKIYALMKQFSVGKTTLYKRRVEAVLLFGIALWGKIIPYWLDLYHLSECRPKKLHVAESVSPDNIE